MTEQQITDSPVHRMDAVNKSREGDRVRGSGAYQRAIGDVELMRDIAFAARKDRSSQVREGLNDGYNALLDHMRQHPGCAAQDAAVLREFQLQINKLAFDNKLSDDDRDRMLEGVLKHHANNNGQELSDQPAVARECELEMWGRAIHPP